MKNKLKIYSVTIPNENVVTTYPDDYPGIVGAKVYLTEEADQVIKSLERKAAAFDAMFNTFAGNGRSAYYTPKDILILVDGVNHPNIVTRDGQVNPINLNEYIEHKIETAYGVKLK